MADQKSTSVTRQGQYTPQFVETQVSQLEASREDGITEAVAHYLLPYLKGMMVKCSLVLRDILGDILLYLRVNIKLYEPMYNRIEQKYSLRPAQPVHSYWPLGRPVHTGLGPIKHMSMCCQVQLSPSSFLYSRRLPPDLPPHHECTPLRSSPRQLRASLA